MTSSCDLFQVSQQQDSLILKSIHCPLREFVVLAVKVNKANKIITNQITCVLWLATSGEILGY